jgi:hypothetical protein
MARKIAQKVDETSLTKGQIRKLNALRKSVGLELGTEAFTKWLALQPETAEDAVDKDALVIAEALFPLVQQKKLKISRGGYLVRRGRGRVVVESASK